MLLEGAKQDISHHWVDLTDISDNVQLAVMCAEDQYFIIHNGLDFKAIGEAEQRNEKGGRLRGASTISQQVAKNVFLWPDRSWLRKGMELYFTLLIESVWSKERIMEVYLNVAEFGDGIFGAEAASRAYFKKSCNELSNRQAALLAAVLPSPKKYSATQPSSYVFRRVRWIENQMSQWGGKMVYDEDFVNQMIN